GNESLFGTLIPGLPHVDAANQPNFQMTGLLTPGTYTLTGGTAGNGNLTAINSAYTVNFSVSSASQAIPLPATGWMGAIGLFVSGCVACRIRMGSKPRTHRTK